MTKINSPAALRDVLLAPPAHPGDLGTLGRYRIKSRLGEGAAGVVFLAFDTALQRKVALKVLRPGDPAGRERFLREARAAARVRSPHVVTIYDVGEELGNPVIAMEYLKGCSAAQYLSSKGELALDHVLRIGVEVGLGLAAAHKLGMVHRDIKPANVWLSAPNGRAKILDFGLARRVSDPELTATGAIAGTPSYMSPEQARGEELDHRSDLFSTGAMLYRLATGQLPFRGDTLFARLRSVQTAEPPRPRDLNPGIPDGLEQVLLKALAKDPDGRFQSAAELVRTLQKIIAETQGPAVAGPQVLPLVIQPAQETVWDEIDDLEAAPTRRRPARRRGVPWVPVATAGAIATVLGLLLFFGTRNRRPDSGEQPVAKASGDPKPALALPGPKPAAPNQPTPGKVPVAKKEPDPLPPDPLPAPPELAPPPREANAARPEPPDEPPGPKDPKVAVPKNKEPKGKPAAPTARDAALWALGVGKPDERAVGVKTAGGEVTVKNPAELPAGEFTLFALRVPVARGEGHKVTDADLKRFAALLSDLRDLNLGDSQVTDLGLAHLAKSKQLVECSLAGTKVGDAGVAHLAGCGALRDLGLSYTLVTDAGLAKLTGCRALGEINLWGCKGVSPKGVAAALKTFSPDGGVVYLNDDSAVTIADATKLSQELPRWAFHFHQRGIVRNGRLTPSP